MKNRKSGFHSIFLKAGGFIKKLILNIRPAVFKDKGERVPGVKSKVKF